MPKPITSTKDDIQQPIWEQMQRKNVSWYIKTKHNLKSTTITYKKGHYNTI